MDITIQPEKLSGALQAIPSKSQAHRLLICSAFSDKPTKLICPETNEDIEATADCLRAIGATVSRTKEGYEITPITKVPEHAKLNCRESGSTLRFMLPIVGALGINGIFVLSGRLPQRPLTPLWEVLEEHGCVLSRPSDNEISISGQLQSGKFEIDGGVSSQYITGLLFALSILPGQSTLEIIGELQSKPYVGMTCHALKTFGVEYDGLNIFHGLPYSGPDEISVEGDWSNGAFFLAANALGSDISISNLAADSLQGDRFVVAALERLESNVMIDAMNIPDLVPILAVVAGAKNGATFINIQRLRLKESDRVATVVAMLNALGAKTKVTHDTLTVYPARYTGCTISSASDHRIAMAAAIAATVASNPVTILDAQCVAKSYPSFWYEYRKLGGNYEQYIR